MIADPQIQCSDRDVAFKYVSVIMMCVSRTAIRMKRDYDLQV